ncbi:MAG: FlgD immunoglobulin-like domain containing protein, partial [Elusimicrobiota bacterium]
NDAIIFRFANPLDSGVTLSIFDTSGALVNTISAPSGADQILWDAKSGSGEPLHSGIYIYQLVGEGKIYNGAIVVAR